MQQTSASVRMRGNTCTHTCTRACTQSTAPALPRPACCPWLTRRRRHVYHLLPLLGRQRHAGQEGGRPLQHVVPRHVLGGGPNRHLALVHNQAHLGATQGGEGEERGGAARSAGCAPPRRCLQRTHTLPARPPACPPALRPMPTGNGNHANGNLVAAINH